MLVQGYFNAKIFSAVKVWLNAMFDPIKSRLLWPLGDGAYSSVSFLRAKKGLVCRYINAANGYFLVWFLLRHRLPSAWTFRGTLEQFKAAKVAGNCLFFDFHRPFVNSVIKEKVIHPRYAQFGRSVCRWTYAICHAYKCEFVSKLQATTSTAKLKKMIIYKASWLQIGMLDVSVYLTNLYCCLNI